MEPVVRYALTDDQLAQLRAFHADTERCPDRSFSDLRREVEATDEVVALAHPETEDLLAAARVYTDYSTYARVYEVAVTTEHRGEGLGRQLMEAVVTHPALANVEQISLDCHESLIPFYRRCGFERHDTTVVTDGGDVLTMVYRDD